MRAVAQVVLNRARHPAFPKSVCGVVFQGAGRRVGCQFSFTCDGSMRGRVNRAAWNRARDDRLQRPCRARSTPASATRPIFHTTGVSPGLAQQLPARQPGRQSHLLSLRRSRRLASNAFSYAARGSTGARYAAHRLCRHRPDRDRAPGRSGHRLHGPAGPGKHERRVRSGGFDRGSRFPPRPSRPRLWPRPSRRRLSRPPSTPPSSAHLRPDRTQASRSPLDDR